jgi:hypothetical protein
MTSHLFGEECLDFTLKYAGPLVSSAATSAKRLKSQLRVDFDKQFAVLWKEHPILHEQDPGRFDRKPPRHFRTVDAHNKPAYQSDIWYRCLVSGIDYVPLVTYGHRMHCHLSIRLHSRRGRGGIIHEGADLDNRLKVLLDALSMPNVGQDASLAATDNEEPLVYCLLEDDELVTKLSVETLRLLRDDVNDPNYVEADIDVHVTPIAPLAFNYPLLFP